MGSLEPPLLSEGYQSAHLPYRAERASVVEWTLHAGTREGWLQVWGCLTSLELGYKF